MRNNYPGQSTLQYKARPMGYAEMLQQREKARGEEGELLCVSIINCRGCPIGLIRYELHPMLLFCVMKERNKHVYPYSCKYLVYIISYHIMFQICSYYIIAICSYLMHNIFSYPLYLILPQKH